MEDGLSALGFGPADLDQLVEGALPQDRVNKLAPRWAGGNRLGTEQSDLLTDQFVPLGGWLNISTVSSNQAPLMKEFAR